MQDDSLPIETLDRYDDGLAIETKDRKQDRLPINTLNTQHDGLPIEHKIDRMMVYLLKYQKVGWWFID